MAIPVGKVDRTVRHDFIEQRAMGGSRGKVRERPTSPLDPWDGTMSLRVASDRVDIGILASKVMQRATGHDQAAAIWMDVGVLKAWNHRSALERGDPGARSYPSVDLLMRTNGNDAAGSEGNCLGP